MNRIKWMSLGIVLCSAMVGISRADEALEKDAQDSNQWVLPL